MFLGIDIGSTTFKAVLLTEGGKVKHMTYQRTRPVEDGKVTCSGHCARCGKCNLGALRNTIETFLANAGISSGDIASTVVTGSQIVEDLRSFIDYDCQVSEVSAHVAGARLNYPNVKAILDVGGQDSKAMIYNEDMGMWVSKMSGVCAAGTGAFLDSVAQKLNVPVEDMADRINYDSDLEVSSICAVLSATSLNKFKNRYPIGDLICAACRAQARTVMSGVGEILLHYEGDIIFQGGVASNRAVAYFLRQITGNNIVIPEFHQVMGALGAATLAREHHQLKSNLITTAETIVAQPKLKSVGMRAKQTRKEFLSSLKGNKPMVWRNLFFPTEILNALGVRMLTLETYAALFARNQKRIKKALDQAAYKGFSAETCTFLRVLEGEDLPKPQFALSTSEPCQQGERIFLDLARSHGFGDKFYSLHTPLNNDDNAVEHIAEGLEEAVSLLEKNLGVKMDQGKLQEACHLSNQARELASECNKLRFTSPPLIRGSVAVYFSAIFSQLWGKRELIDIHQQLLDELNEKKLELEGKMDMDDTHRLLWLHLPPFYNTRLLDHIEVTCNAPIVFEEVNFVDWEPLDVANPYRALARKLLTVGFLDNSLRVKHIIDNAKAAKFNGCVLYNHGFGRCSMADSCFIKHLREELQSAKVPLLVLDGDCVDPTTDPCSTYTKISAYIEALNAKKFGSIFGKAKSQNLASTIDRLEKDNDIIPFDQASSGATGEKAITS